MRIMRLYHRQSTLVSAYVSTSLALWPRADFPHPNLCASLSGACGRGAAATKSAAQRRSGQRVELCHSSNSLAVRCGTGPPANEFPG